MYIALNVFYWREGGTGGIRQFCMDKVVYRARLVYPPIRHTPARSLAPRRSHSPRLRAAALQVTVPSVPTDRMEREEVFQSIATVAKRLYPRWDAVHGSGRRNGSYGGNPTVDRSAAIKPSPHCGMEGNAASSTDASDAALSATASLTRPGAFSVAVNRLLRTTPSVQLDSRPPRVSPENLRSMLLRTAREGSSRCCLCRLSLASGCDCSAAFLRESRCAKPRLCVHACAYENSFTVQLS